MYFFFFIKVVKKFIKGFAYEIQYPNLKIKHTPRLLLYSYIIETFSHHSFHLNMGEKKLYDAENTLKIDTNFYSNWRFFFVS